MKIKVFLLMLSVLLFNLISCSEQEKATVALEPPSCLVSQSLCQISTQLGPLSVLFDHNPITPEVEFAILVGDKTLEQDFNVTGYMEGKNMFMGKIPLFFSSDKKQGYKVANTLLGSCSDKEMVWLVQLTITPISKTGNRQPEHFSIEFTSFRQ